MSSVTIRARPEDFRVEELPAYLPSGSGEHVFVLVRKRALTTPDVARRLALALGLDPRGASWAGLKDKHAVATQWLSFHAPGTADLEPAARAAAGEGLEILEVARHGNKLKPGHLRGNRFELEVGVPPELAGPLSAALEKTGREGVPNSFGYQRFGRASEAEVVSILGEGGGRLPRDSRARRLAMSAAQSVIFNRVLAARVDDGTWCRVLPGDLAKKTDTGGLFLVPLDGPEAEDAARRGDEGTLSATGPIVGVKMREPAGIPLALERRIADEAGVSPGRLRELAKLGEGSRRPLRLVVEELSVCAGSADNTIQVRFSLAKGGYATTVLERACASVAHPLVDASNAGRLPSRPPGLEAVDGPNRSADGEDEDGASDD
jgi:tRNA pseudouridine13 synthase